MDIKRLSGDFAVCGQITDAHIPAIASAGFKALICNRPDNEQSGQQPYSQIAAAAAAHGLTVIFLPVVSGAVTAQDVEQLRDALRDLPTPVLAYCRSGARSTMLWQLTGEN